MFLSSGTSLSTSIPVNIRALIKKIKLSGPPGWVLIEIPDGQNVSRLNLYIGMEIKLIL